MILFSQTTIIYIIAAWLAWRFVFRKRFRAPFMLLVSILFILLQGAPTLLMHGAFLLCSLLTILAGYNAGRNLAGKTPDQTKVQFIIYIIFAAFPLILFKLIGVFLTPAALEYIGSRNPEFDLRFVAPLGLSYLTFRVIAYMIEIRKGRLEPARLGEYILYVTFWPTLLSGPIERPEPFLRQLRDKPEYTSEDLAVGFSRIVTGLFKTLVLGVFFLKLAAPIFSMEKQFGPGLFFKISVPGLWLSAIAYYFHLYLNFSGYSDIAIGLSRIFGYKIRENFQWPFLATNIADFWRRWHMSLTGWITDYVYYGLGGNRRGLKIAARNTLAAMILVGVWHGLALHFIAWGLYHAICLIIYRWWRKSGRGKLNIPDNAMTKFASWALTFVVVTIGWMLFALPTFTALPVILKMTFGALMAIF